MKKLTFLLITVLAFVLTSGSVDVHRKLDRNDSNGLITAAEDKDGGIESVRISASKALGSIDPTARDVVYELIRALKEDEDPNVRISAARALGSMGPIGKQVFNALIDALMYDRDPNVRSSAASSLGLIRPIEAGIVKALISALRKDRDPNVRSSAASSLGLIWREIRED